MSCRNIFNVSIILFVFFFVANGFSMKCWNCRSDLDPNCADPFKNETLAITDCGQVLSYNWEGNEVDSNTCMKIVQIVNGQTIIIRRCAFFNETGNTNDEQGECTRKNGINSLALDECRPNECDNKFCSSCSAQYCKCNTDGCNSSTNLSWSTDLSIICFFAAIQFYVRI